jgi:hypothetical protein
VGAILLVRRARLQYPPRGIDEEGALADVKRLRNRARPVKLTLALLFAAGAVSVPLADGAPQAVAFGKSVTLSGDVPTEAAGDPVHILARAFGEQKFARVATVVTKAGGHWAYDARPRIRTTYLAAWGGTTTSTVEIRVTPFLDLELAKNVLSVRARTARSLTGHYVIVQLRRPGGVWRGIRKVVLDAASNARVPLTPPHGRSDLRLFMPATQVGAGYDAGYSVILVFRNNA